MMLFHSQPVQSTPKISSIKIIRALGAFFAIVFSIAIPSIYLATTIIAAKQVLTVEAAFFARSIGKIIQNRPDLWEFESVRLKEIISKPLFHAAAHEGEIRAATGKLVIKTDFTKVRPIISVSVPFFDSGQLAGSVLITQSIRPQIIATALLGFLSSLFGCLIYYIFRTYPIRKLETTLTDLQRARYELERRVADRTQALQRVRTEISMRKRAEETLFASEARFKALVESSSDRIWEVDANGVYTYTSPKVKDLLGYEPEEVIGKTPFDFMLPEYAARLKSEFGTIAMAQKSFRGKENINVHKDGSLVVLDTNGVPFFDSNLKLCGYRGIDRDITERRRSDEALKKSYADLKNLQAQLVQSGKLASIGELAAGVAHELNQPLMIIRTTAQLMLRKQSRDSLAGVELLEKLNTIEKNTKRMMNIINHLRTFSRQTKSEFTPVSVNKIIQDSFLMIGEQLSLRDIAVTQDLSSDLPKVRGDTNQLEQVFLIYTTKEVGKGTGLGLSISYGIIQDHKGEIDVVETGPAGTTFRIRLPGA
jgi:PAS domain S-box-containing protein